MPATGARLAVLAHFHRLRNRAMASPPVLPPAVLRALRHLPAPLHPPLTLLMRAGMRWMDEGAPQLGAALAFYTMFAMAPLLLIAISVAGAVFGVEAARGQIVHEIQGVVGKEAAKSIEAMVESAWRDPDGLQAAVIGGLTLLLGATGVFTELRRALNRIMHVEPDTSAIGALVKARLTGLALVMGFGFLAIVSLLLSAALQAFSALMPGAVLLGTVLTMLEFAVSTAVLGLAFGALLRWVPDRAPRSGAVFAGALTCAVMFNLGKFLIGLYLSRASVASSYGAAGSFVVVMLWVYYTGQILLFGAAITADASEARGASAPSPSA